MNVLHIDEQRGWRGGEQQASWLIQGLVERGHDVTISGRTGGAFLADDHGGANPHRVALPFRSELDLWSAWKLARVVRRRNIDILHAHTSHAHMAASLSRLFAGRGRVVVSRRVSFPPSTGPLNRWKYGLPDRFISVSAKVDESLRAFGISGRQLEVVYSSVDPKRLDVEPHRRESLGVRKSAPLLVSAGALVGHKDHGTLIEAMAIVLKTKADARLLVAGEGALRPQIEAQIGRLQLDAAVTLLGHRADVPRVLRAADLYVSSSWSEGLGTSVLEAMACEVPVVATDAGGVSEMVHDGETGYLVPNRNPGALAKAILASLDGLERARVMAGNGKRMVLDRFSVERMVDGTIDVYERLVA